MMTFLSTAAAQTTENPFFQNYNTPHQTVPFHLIKNEHYLPAFQEGIRQHQQEVEAIVNNPQPPTFKNTIEALEYSGMLLEKVSGPFFNL